MKTKLRARCGNCNAIVNPKWPACLICRTSIDEGDISTSHQTAEPNAPSSPPLLPGWVVAFRGATGHIQGGTVKTGHRQGGAWVFQLENGIALQEGKILSVAKVEGGRWLGAWSVGDFGLDGQGLER